MPPVDFYAGAIATVAVILFAKFNTHRSHDERWKLLHIVCAIAAWLGLILSLLVLGWTVTNVENRLRQAVAIMVMIAGSILALDVAWPPQPRGQHPAPQEAEQTGIEQTDSTSTARPDDQPPAQVT